MAFLFKEQEAEEITHPSEGGVAEGGVAGELRELAECSGGVLVLLFTEQEPSTILTLALEEQVARKLERQLMEVAKCPGDVVGGAGDATLAWNEVGGTVAATAARVTVWEPRPDVI